MTPSPTFLLIHGAGLGGWSWKYVRDKLEALGAKVLTPTLTGLSLSDTRSELIPSLETHIEDVIHVFEEEKLDDVILVGHSYAGMVITGVADRKKKVRSKGLSILMLRSQMTAMILRHTYPIYLMKLPLSEDLLSNLFQKTGIGLNQSPLSWAVYLSQRILNGSNKMLRLIHCVHGLTR